jgi:preprotein translocase subunit SecA
MYVICIPTRKEIIRDDLSDLIFSNKEGKFKAIVNEIERRHKLGQPILVGTIAIETSELISSMLDKKKIPHEVLNAKNHAREAEIIAKAGQKGSVTIATNMAGRGTDIKLGEGVKELGGLCVIGTERHEARRIDNQLRGRSGRQGDPGVSQFYVSFEDDIMIRFGSDRFKGMLQSMGFTGEQAIRSKIFTGAIESAQKRVEGNNFDIRKQLLQYDDVMNQQRENIYTERNEILDKESIHERILQLFGNYMNDLIRDNSLEKNSLTKEESEKIEKAINEELLCHHRIKASDIENIDINEAIEKISSIVVLDYEDKIRDLPKELVDDFEKAVYLRVIDTFWMEHINTMEHLREGIHLRGYAQINPLQAYTNEGFDLFDQMLRKIDMQTSIYLLKAEVRQNLERKEVAKPTKVNDDDKGSTKKPKTVKKVGRNELCPCGSGKKYKYCCGK